LLFIHIIYFIIYIIAKISFFEKIVKGKCKEKRQPWFWLRLCFRPAPVWIFSFLRRGITLDTNHDDPCFYAAGILPQLFRIS